MAEGPSCRSPYHEEYIQTSASGNPEGLYIKLQLSIREKMNAEFPASSSLPMFIQFLKALYRFHPLLTRLFDISAETVLRIFFRDFHWFIV